jgi:hypothetical protein
MRKSERQSVNSTRKYSKVHDLHGKAIIRKEDPKIATTNQMIMKIWRDMEVKVG